MFTWMLFYCMGVGSVLFFPEIATSVLTYFNKRKEFEKKMAYYISYITKDTRELVISENSKTRDLVEDYMDEIRHSLKPKQNRASP